MELISNNSIRFRRAAAIILSVLMIVVVLLSSIVISVNAHHDCPGEECQVCECIELCIGILTRFGAKSTSSVPAVIQRAVPIAAIVFAVYISITDSPVSRKERLNN